MSYTFVLDSTDINYRYVLCIYLGFVLFRYWLMAYLIQVLFTLLLVLYFCHTVHFNNRIRITFIIENFENVFPLPGDQNKSRKTTCSLNKTNIPETTISNSRLLALIFVLFYPRALKCKHLKITMHHGNERY